MGTKGFAVIVYVYLFILWVISPAALLIEKIGEKR